jgi:hypothetical protein
MAMFLNVAQIDATPGKPQSIVTSATSANIKMPVSAPNAMNTTAGQAGGPQDLAGRGLWLVYVSGSAVNVRFGLTAPTAVGTDPVWGLGWLPLPIAIPPGTFVAALGTATAGRVDFFRVYAFRD